MKQEQLIAYSLLLFIAIPLVITTLGGMLILNGSANFFPYAKFLYVLTLSLGLLLFIQKNFKVQFGWGYILIISLFHTLSLRHSFLFKEVSFIINFLLVLLFFAGILLCIRYIFLNRDLRSIRTVLFALLGGAVFTGVFVLLMKFSGRGIDGMKAVLQDFSMGFMLLATIGIGFLLTDITLNAIAAHYHLKPDLLTPDPEIDDDDDDEIISTDGEEQIDKDEND